jgi:hypothetical protein
MFSAKTGEVPREQGREVHVPMGMTQAEYQALVGAIDKALAQFEGKPSEPGFDLEIYDELRRVREAVLRAGRDLRDVNIRRDSKSPLGTE